MAPDVIFNVGLAFVFIAVASLLAARLNFSSIPLLILAGMLFGPHAPLIGTVSLELITSTESMELLSRLGVLLLLFYLGLEFSAGKLAEAGKSILNGGTVYVLLNILRGLGIGWLFFDSWTEAMVVAGITGVSSSAIITKLLMDLKRAANPETELILGIMVFEDVFVAAYLSILSGMLVPGDFNISRVLINILVIFAFIISVLVFGRRLSGFLGKLFRLKSNEAFSVIIFTLVLMMGVLADRLHITEAIGALLLGLILAETAHNHRILISITPMRDLFGAVFFFSFGMAIDYRTFPDVAAISGIAVLITVTGNIINGYIASWLAGYKKRKATNVAFTIMARGEFSIIIAGLAAAAGLNPRLPAFAALYVLALAFVSPVLAKHTKFFHSIPGKFHLKTPRIGTTT